MCIDTEQHDLGPLGRPEIGPRKASEFLWDRHDVTQDANNLPIIKEDPADRAKRRRIKTRRLGAVVFLSFVLAWAVALSIVVPRGKAAKSQRSATLVTDVDQKTQWVAEGAASADREPTAPSTPGDLGGSSTKDDDPPEAGPPSSEEEKRPARDAGPDVHEAGREEEEQPAQDLNDATPPETMDESRATTEPPAPTPVNQAPETTHAAAAVSDGADEDPNTSDQPRPGTHEAVQDDGDPNLGAVIDSETLYREVGGEAIYRLAKSYRQINTDVEVELLQAYPNIDDEGLRNAKEALVDLLEQVEGQVSEPGGWGPDGWGPDGWDNVDSVGSLERTRAYEGGHAKYENYGTGTGGYGYGKQVGYYGGARGSNVGGGYEEHGGYRGGGRGEYGRHAYDGGRVAYGGYDGGRRERYGGHGGYGGY